MEEASITGNAASACRSTIDDQRSRPITGLRGQRGHTNVYDDLLINELGAASSPIGGANAWKTRDMCN